MGTFPFFPRKKGNVPISTLLSADSGANTPLTTVRVASGLSKPLFLVSPPGDLDRQFVVEQRGKIKIIKEGVVLNTPFIDLSGKVSASGNEKGLLGLAFHPDYDLNGFFYVNYTRASGGATVVERYKVSGNDPDLADPASGTLILGPITQLFSNHNGGCIKFGPDGKLYVGMGDGGSGGDPDCNAQKGTTLLGKMLRINEDGTVPADNPFVGDPNILDEIWHKGLRNPWRFSFDRATGDMYIADVGQSSREEIDFQGAGSTGNENWGWKVMEGTLPYGNGNCPPGTPPPGDPSLLLPIHEYDHSGGKCSISGGYVYRGCAIPDLQGTYFFADYCTAQIWSFRYDGNTLTDFQERTAELAPNGFSINWITSFGEDGDGEVYVIDQGSGQNNGEIFKIVPDVPPVYEDLGNGLPGTGGVIPKLDICGLMGSGDTAIVRLRKAAPSSPAFLVASTSQGSLPLFGGTLVPGLPTPLLFVVATNAEGKINLSINGGGGPLDLYVHYLIDDPGAVQGVSFSNAIKAVFQP